MWNDIYQTQIDAMDEGSKKALEQMEFNHEKRLQAIDREKEDLLQKKKKKLRLSLIKGKIRMRRRIPIIREKLSILL